MDSDDRDAADAATSRPGAPPGDGRLTPLREMQLVEAHCAGDPAALAELLRSYQRRIYAICARMVRSADEAADLTQDALVKLIEGLDTYDGRAAFSTWAIRIAMNCCLSHLRRERIRRHGSLDEPDADDPPRWRVVAESAEPGPARRVEHAEMRSMLLRALKELDPQMRAILVLRDLQDLDYGQIGEVLDVPVGTVKSRLFRARVALRQATEARLAPGDDGPHDRPAAR